MITELDFGFLQYSNDDVQMCRLSDPDRIGVLLTNSIFEAHTRTSLLSREQISDGWQAGIDPAKLFAFKNMSQEDLWLSAAQKLTSMITQIIEFAKMVPGFMKFPQDDQIVLLKGGVFELAVIRMSRYFDCSQKAVLFLDCMLPMDAFMNTRDTTEMKLVSQIFDYAKSLAEMQLSEVAIALYSAYILLQEGEQRIYSRLHLIQPRLIQPAGLTNHFDLVWIFMKRKKHFGYYSQPLNTATLA